MKYVYPAIITEIAGEGYGVEFPDLQGCVDEFETLYDAVEESRAGLADWLNFLIETQKPIPAASDIRSLKLEKNQIATLITADTKSYNARR